MFQGVTSLKLDAKGRFTVPSRHREMLMGAAQEAMTLTKHPDGCLMLFPHEEWRLFSQRIASLPLDAQWWKRFFLGNAMEVEMDGAGRILISPELRKSTNIQKELVLLGMGKNIELWDKATYEAKEAIAMQSPPPDVFKNFSF